MPISNSHNDLFHNSGTLEKINLFQTLLDSQDLTSMEALALLNTIHKELESPQGHDRAVYIQYAQMMERFENKMPELHKEVVRKWAELQYILKSRQPKKENDSDSFDVDAEEGKKSPQVYKAGPQTPPSKVTGTMPLKPAPHKDFELENQEEVGGAEAEEEIEEEVEESEKEEEKEIEAGKETEGEEEKETEEKESEEDEEKEEETEKEEDESEEKEEKEETETEENKEEESEERESEEEEEKEEKEEETETEEVEEKGEEESKNNEREEEGGEVAQKEIAEEAEEPDRMAVEAAEAAHAAGEIEPAEEMELHEPEPLIDEEEPPMEAAG